MTENEILFSLLRSQLHKMPVEEQVQQNLTPEILNAVCKLADAHDLGHMVGQALSECKNLPQTEAVIKAKQRAMQALVRYMTQTRDLLSICKALEEAQIPHIPLKGSVLRDYYPEPWFRTSGDIDVLVQQGDLEQASQILQEKLGYQYQALSNHDVALRTPAGTYLELHFAVTEDMVSPVQSEIMSHVWEKAVPADAKQYEKKMSDEMFYFYHIAHMAKHFLYGGCGIRPLMDIWVMHNRMSFDREKCIDLLRQGNLDAFAMKAEKLANIWFSGDKTKQIYQEMESYILGGGVYGTVENRVIISNVRSGGKVKYIFSRVFLSYDDLKYYYPVLFEKKWLYPFCQIARWFDLAFGKGKAHTAEVFRSSTNLEGENIDRTSQFLKEIGL